MRHVLFVVGVLALNGCLDATDPEPVISYGSILLNAVPSGEGAAMQPSAVFFRARRNSVSIPNSQAVVDRCGVDDFSPGAGPGEQLGDISAGDALAMTLGEQQLSIPRVPQGAQSFNYETPTSIAFAPGATATIEVPGVEGEFPASNIQVVTAPAFTLDPVAVPAQGEELVLRWAPAPTNATSAMIISLQYARPTTTALNEQIYCVLVDDGEHAVEPGLLLGWREGTGAARRVVATRVQTARKDLDGALLHAYSSFQLSGTVTEE